MFKFKNAVITGGNFIASNGIMLDSRGAKVQRGIQILQENICPGAFHDSAERHEPPKCLPHTREAVLKKISDWVKDGNLSKKLFLWLYGPAGAGKSAIAQSIADMCEQEGLLAGAFFFSRTASGRNDETRLLATLAYQITLSIPDTRELIALAIERDPSIVSRSLISQIRTLIVDPLTKAQRRRDPKDRTLLIIVDGLDECGDSQAQRNVLQALCTLAKAPIPIIFLIASRPEYWIRDVFNVEPLSSLVLGVALDDTYRPEDDLKRYFDSQFEEIKDKHPLKAQLPLLWPSSLAVEQLVKKSSGQFIYASTVMNYISCAESRDPQERLDVVLGVSPCVDDAPFAQLDAIYMHILRSTSNIPKVLDILSLLILDPYVRKYPTDIHTIRFINELFNYVPGELEFYTRDLSAIVYVPTPDDHPNHLDQKIRVYHASFVDFILDRSRAGPFFLDSSLYHSRLARSWIQLYSAASLKGEHSYGMLNIPNPTTQNMIIISHCIRSTPDQALIEDLRHVNVIAHLYPSDTCYLDQPGHPVVRFTRWLATYDELSPRKLRLDGPDYHMSRIDKWVSDSIDGYPGSFKRYLSVLLCFPEFLAKHYRRLYSLLVSSENAYYAVQISKHDAENFRLKRGGPDAFDVGLLEMIKAFLSDKRRSGKFCVTPEKYSELAITVSQYLFGRSFTETNSSDSEGEAEGERYPFRRMPGVINQNDSDEELEEPEMSVALTFLPLILEKSPVNTKLAGILQEHALQFSSTDTYYTERRDLAIASLSYIRMCRLPQTDHRHEIEWIHDVCIICSEVQLNREKEEACQGLQGNMNESSKPLKTISRLFKKRY